MSHRSGFLSKLQRITGVRPERFNVRHFAWLSIFAALATIALKMLAWWLTGSVGMLSDALESFVNLAGASAALMLLTFARQPPDREHPFGHGKAEYFSSGFEGVLILGAALAIAIAAISRLLQPQALASVQLGLVFSLISTLINGAVAFALLRAAKRFRSIALEADGRHLLTDVWTSIGVVVGVLLVEMTGYLWLDPVIALLVAANITRVALNLLRNSLQGLLDESLHDSEVAQIETVLKSFADRGVFYKNLRTRRSGAYAFINIDILVPGNWQVDVAHDLLDEIEIAIAGEIPDANVVTHLEPIH